MIDVNIKNARENPIAYEMHVIKFANESSLLNQFLVFIKFDSLSVIHH